MSTYLKERKKKKMKFVSFQLKDGNVVGEVKEKGAQDQWGIVKKDKVIMLSGEGVPYSTLIDFIEGGEVALSYIKGLDMEALPSYSFEQVNIAAPLTVKKNVICVGKNYRDHALEMSNQDPNAIPKHPVLFTKPHTSLNHHQGTIPLYKNITSQVDYEGELAVVIGKRGKDIPKEEALNYIFGYSILNDVTARDLQKQHIQFFKGKSLDQHAPFGPYIVHRSHIEDPQNLSIKTFVSEELRQNGNTRDMIFTIAELIEVVSAGMTLEPGDVIATGTPSGVGSGFKPPKFLQSGDVVRIEIEGIGILENKVE
jgi:2-keto-4-pentenoate hydratase/2-oxohepta-3-ene-1,7-dioic acid hydratase in catechol pathway